MHAVRFDCSPAAARRLVLRALDRTGYLVNLETGERHIKATFGPFSWMKDATIYIEFAVADGETSAYISGKQRSLIKSGYITENHHETFLEELEQLKQEYAKLRREYPHTPRDRVV